MVFWSLCNRALYSFFVISSSFFSFLKDEDSIPLHLRDTDEYRELMELKRLKRQKIAEVRHQSCVFTEDCVT